MIDSALVQRFTRPITSANEAEFWARVRIATSSEHGLNIAATTEVREYIQFREQIRQNMLKKFMYTSNTVAAMEQQKKTALIPNMLSNHECATDIFQWAIEQLLQSNKVIELPATLTTKASITHFINRLPRTCELIFLSQKQYGSKNQAAVANDIRSICQQNGHKKLIFGCQFNKQKQAMSHELYLNSTVGILFQLRLLENGRSEDFDYDPGVFPFFMDCEGKPLYSMSRRMDGAYPSSINPFAIWEVKEYYDNKTYGSRVNDSIYETILSGGECRDIQRLCGGERVQHFLFVDGYFGLGVLGRALLLRYIDCFFQNVVDDIVVGTDVRNAWPVIADRIVLRQNPARGCALFHGM